MTIVEAGAPATELDIETPVILGLPAEVAAAFTAEATSAVEAEINELATDLGLPVRARVMTAANLGSSFTIEIHGRTRPCSDEHLTLAYRASEGWAETPPDRDPVSWLADGLRNQFDVVTMWFRMWARATLSASPALLVTEPVLARYRDCFREHPCITARRLAESADGLALLLRTVVERKVAVPLERVLEKLDAADGGEKWCGDPAVLAEWLVYQLRPDLVTVRLAPDVPQGMVAGIVAADTNRLRVLQEEFARTWGLPAPRILVTVDEAVPAGRCDVTVNSVRSVAMPPLPAGTRCVRSLAEGQAGTPVGNPFTGVRTFLVDAGTETAAILDSVLDWVRHCLWQCAPCFVEKWTLDQCLHVDRWYCVNWAVQEWSELGPSGFGLPRLVHQLMLEGQPVTNLPYLLEHLADRIAGGVADDPLTSTRRALSRAFGARVLAESTYRPAVRLGRLVEAGLVDAATGWTPVLPPADGATAALVAEIRLAVGDWPPGIVDPVVLCDCDPALVARALRADYATALVSRVDDLPPTMREMVPKPEDATVKVALRR